MGVCFCLRFRLKKKKRYLCCSLSCWIPSGTSSFSAERFSAWKINSFWPFYCKWWMIPGLTRMGYQKVLHCNEGTATNHVYLNGYQVSHRVAFRAGTDHDRSPRLSFWPSGKLAIFKLLLTVIYLRCFKCSNNGYTTLYSNGLLP